MKWKIKSTPGHSFNLSITKQFLTTLTTFKIPYITCDPSDILLTCTCHEPSDILEASREFHQRATCCCCFVFACPYLCLFARVGVLGHRRGTAVVHPCGMPPTGANIAALLLRPRLLRIQPTPSSLL